MIDGIKLMLLNWRGRTLRSIENTSLNELREAELCVERGKYNRARELINRIGNPYQETEEKNIDVINRINILSAKLVDVKYSKR